MSRTLEQYRAKYALDRILQVQSLPDQDKAKYATLVRKLPTMILNNGLGQALAFLLADDEGSINGGERKAGGQVQWIPPEDNAKPPGRLYRHLEQWLTASQQANHSNPSPVYPNSPAHMTQEEGQGQKKRKIGRWQNQLITQLMAGDRALYLRAQQEALALLVWMKKFADAYLPKGGD